MIQKTWLQKTWLQSRYLEIDRRPDSDMSTSGSTPQYINKPISNNEILVK
jgi:hypothetical protein